MPVIYAVGDSDLISLRCQLQRTALQKINDIADVRSEVNRVFRINRIFVMGLDQLEDVTHISHQLFVLR